MSKKETFSIIKQGHELIKIIPIGSSNHVEFKMIINADINHFYWNINYDCITWKDGAITMCNTLFASGLKGTPAEYTYHRSRNGKPTKIHFKLSESGSNLYVNVRDFSNLYEPNTTQILPIPLCKIACHDVSQFPVYNPNSKKIVSDMSKEIEHNLYEHNVVEIYMIGKGSAYFHENFEKTWNLFHMIEMLLPIEYFSVPNFGNMSIKKDGMKSSGILQYHTQPITNDISFLICTYYSDVVAKNGKTSSISFFENGDYLKILSCTRVQYYNDLTGMKSAIRYAYEWQLDENKHLLKSMTYQFWERRFKHYARDYKRNKIKLPILQLPMRM